MDEITEDEIKRSTRMKHYQQYQNYIDSLDKADSKGVSESSKTGNLSGKTIKLIEGENTSIEKIFNRFRMKDS